MNKSLLSLFALSCIFFFSGCSLNSNNKDRGFTLSPSLWKSEDGGKTWQVKDKGEGSASISDADVLSLAVNPGNGENVYAGLKKGGILVSDNGGQTWHFMNFQSEKVYGLALDPNSSALYASGVWQGTGKIFKTEDAGQNWKEIYTGPAAGPLVISMAIDKKNSNAVYASTSNNEVIKSFDGGNSWKNIYLADSPIIKIAIDAVNGNLIYLMTDSGSAFRSQDGGGNFEDITGRIDKSLFGFSSNQFSILEADPLKSGNVYLAGAGGIIFSQDKGETWQKISVLGNTQEFPIRALAINPQNSNELVYATAQAVYKSAGKTNGNSFNWTTSQFSTKKSANALFYNPSNPNVVYLGFSK
jgi:photosystem II stability/assembly factor-like uncharacterized protein